MRKVGAMSKRGATNAADEEDSASTSKRFRAAVDESASHFICAITQELPLEPVTAEDGNVHERTAEEWLRTQQKSPLTNKPMGTRLLPAHQAKSMIETMVKSGAISGDKADSWRKRLEEEGKVAELKAKAEAGDVLSMRTVGKNLIFGKNSFAKDEAQGFRWFERAAKRGDGESLRCLSNCYTSGLGVAEDTSMGLMLMTEAATLGESIACRVLGDAYAAGWWGLKQNIRWFAGLASSRKIPATEHLTRHGRSS